MSANKKTRLQRSVRIGLINLGYQNSLNLPTDEIIELIRKLYPECVVKDEWTRAQKSNYAFNYFLKKAKENNLSLQPLPKKKKERRNPNPIREILINLGELGDSENPSSWEMYQLIKKIHPELTIIKGTEKERKKVFEIFNRLYTDEKLTESEKKNILKTIQDNREAILSKKQKNKTKEYQKQKQLFYKSGAWRAIRYEVIKEQKGQCQLCGRSRKDGVVLHVDHIIPLSKDWSKRLCKENLQVLCEDCNLGKSNSDEIDWR